MKVSARQIATAWYQALQDSPASEWSTISQRMLDYLYKRGELRRLKDIKRFMAQLEHEQNHTTAVTVRSATAVPTAVLEHVLHQVLPNITPIITQTQDPSVIGGVQIETNDERFDLSLRGQLRQLNNALTS